MVLLGVSQAALQEFYFRVADRCWWEGRVGAVLPPSPSHSTVLTGAAISNSLTAAGSPSEVLGALCLVRKQEK